MRRERVELPNAIDKHNIVARNFFLEPSHRTTGVSIHTPARSKSKYSSGKVVTLDGCRRVERRNLNLVPGRSIDRTKLLNALGGAAAGRSD
jgi:hypothetical protein